MAWHEWTHFQVDHYLCSPRCMGSIAKSDWRSDLCPPTPLHGWVMQKFHEVSNSNQMSSLESHGKLAPLSLQEDYTGLLILRSLKHGDARDAACSWLHRIGPDRRSRRSTARLIYRNGSRVWCVFAPFCTTVGSSRQFLQGPWSGLPKFGVIDVRILWGVKHYYYIRQRWQICRKNRRSVLVVLNASVWNCDRFTPISMHLNAFRHLGIWRVECNIKKGLPRRFWLLDSWADQATVLFNGNP